MSTAITASHIRQYDLCPCGLYLEFHGPEQEKAAAHAFAEHLQKLGREHEARIVATLPHVPVPDGPLSERAATTLDFCCRSRR